ncbi:4'-phosphopantetheinyl transferase family protein [Clostridium beijerinckii]|uniref:4'-phosphopantetheinyl transferase n=1 Tax=Clostridium beijerinckii TaxID=1520 RepID=A0AAE5H1E8_CLOBE|nr:4'-phosphopantetheinyl transferase superfamily protein [Clostridium beijerinckii]NSB12311.1 4'-phosphopantetheinyl transferase [Clostridium beijerinckii]OOM30805.1 4'-phosphopantetheinyl transferase sfp [Clostridium beijerinckii]
MIYYYDNIEDFSDIDLMNSYYLLDYNRIEKIKKYHFIIDKKLSAISYLLLRYALKFEYGIEETFNFRYGKYGKPYLEKYPCIKFNLTHCKQGVACIISRNEVGIDAELISSNNIICSNTILTQKEMCLLENSKDPEIIFTRLWTIKESYLKNIGTGLNGNINKLDFSQYNENMFIYDEKTFCCRKLRNVFLTTCANEVMDFKILKKKELFK